MEDATSMSDQNNILTPYPLPSCKDILHKLISSPKESIITPILDAHITAGDNANFYFWGIIYNFS